MADEKFFSAKNFMLLGIMVLILGGIAALLVLFPPKMDQKKPSPKSAEYPGELVSLEPMTVSLMRLDDNKTPFLDSHLSVHVHLEVKDEKPARWIERNRMQVRNIVNRILSPLRTWEVTDTLPALRQKKIDQLKTRILLGIQSELAGKPAAESILKVYFSEYFVSRVSPAAP
jgi:flagellar basal body-associated protein FliL